MNYYNEFDKGKAAWLRENIRRDLIAPGDVDERSIADGGTMMQIRVIGEPAPQGSKRPVGNGRMVESSKKVKPWRDSVAWATREVCGDCPPLAIPCGVRILFYLPRPKKPKFPKYPGTKPDIDKLVRSTLDGLTNGGAFVDDALAVICTSSKLWADPEKGKHVGAVIEIWEAD